MNLITKQCITVKIGILLFLLCCAGCTDLSEVVYYDLETESSAAADLSTLYPEIQAVYPGSMQTLDIPQDIPSDIDPATDEIIVIFSHLMENDAGEMGAAFQLLQNGELTPAQISPESTSAKMFSISRAVGEFDYGNTYTLRIFRYATVDDANDRPLKFTNLIEIPATSLSPVDPDYVEFSFQTSEAKSEDNEKPYLLASSPSDGDTDVPVTLSSTSGRIVLTFYDNINPMIYPFSVTENTVQLYEMGTGNVDINIEMETDDLNYKTYYVYPIAPLSNATSYRLTISIGNTIEDFSGNLMDEVFITFFTEE